MVCYTIAQCIKIQINFDEILFSSKHNTWKEKVCLVHNQLFKHMIHSSFKENNDMNNKRIVTKLSTILLPL